MKNNAIGIIGGMGPEASEKFYGLLIRHAQKDFGVEKNEDFPEIYLASIPVPDFISSEEHKQETLEMLVTRVKELDKLPIDFFCMACNTGHLLIGQLQKVTQKPFVSLLDELPLFIKNKGLKKVGILATPTTIKSRMYELVLNKHDIRLLIPDKKDTEVLGQIIKDTIAGKNQEQNSVIAQQIARELLDRGALGIIEGCTEIPLIFPKQHLVPVFDTLEILALAVLKRYYRR